MIIQRLGHAALLVEVAGARILLDPGTYSASEAFELRDLDAIVVTHQHADHADAERLPALLAGNPQVKLLAEPQTAQKLASLASWSTFGPNARFDVGGATVAAVGGRHAIIHPDVPAIGNVGVMIRAPQEPALFHPGDAYEPAPDGVDVLALPLSAPWAKVSETVDFARRVGARTVFPIHDAGLSETGHATFWRNVIQLGGDARFERVGATDRFEP